MPPFQIHFTRSAAKELERLNAALQERILRAVERLAESPRPHGSVKLEGADDLYRIRVGDYRVIYAIDDAHRIVDIRAVRHRSDAYR